MPSRDEWDAAISRRFEIFADKYAVAFKSVSPLSLSRVDVKLYNSGWITLPYKDAEALGDALLRKQPGRG